LSGSRLPQAQQIHVLLANELQKSDVLEPVAGDTLGIGNQRTDVMIAQLFD